jgi:hypothetical protein
VGLAKQPKLFEPLYQHQLNNNNNIGARGKTLTPKENEKRRAKPKAALKLN